MKYSFASPKRLAQFLLLGALATSCVTPMQQGEIDDLTTCRNTTLKKIRKNLLLSGFEITDMTDEDLTTDYKQVGGYGTSQSYERVTVVKMDEKTFRFRIRSRNDSMKSVSTGSSTQTITTSHSNSRGRSNRGHKRGRKNGRKHKDSQTYTNTTDHRQLVSTSNETDKRYYEDYRGRYASTQRSICGSGY